MSKHTDPQFSREEIKAAAIEMANELAKDLAARILEAHEALTSDEVTKVESDPRCKGPYFVVRALAMAIGDDILSDRFEAEATRPHTRRIKSILSKRVW